MPSQSSDFSVYEVRADQARLKRESLGPLFVRLSVELNPPDLDANWQRAYQAISSESEKFSRFTLDVDNGAVFFTCRANETPAEIQTLMQRLVLLLELANLRATMDSASLQSETA
jgi:hypothetical protein